MTLKSIHPITAFVYFVLVSSVMMISRDPVLQCIALVSVCTYSFLLFGVRVGFSDIAFYLPLLLMISVINPMFSHNGMTPLFFLNGNPVTLEAVLYGIVIGISVIAVLYLCKCFSEIMTGDKILYLLGNIMPKMALMISMTLGFVPLFKERYKKKSEAQRTLGVYSAESRADRLKCALAVFSATVSQSLERSVELSASMKARGYGAGKRSSYSLFRFTASDILLLTACIILSAVIFIFFAIGTLDFAFYPKMSDLSFDLAHIISYGAFFVLAFIPSALEIKENLKWKYLISKI